jgi:membrane protein YdbS with pleckstrin-like domain
VVIKYVTNLCALTNQCLYYLNSIWNSRVLGHGIHIILYALIRLVTIIILLKYITWSIYTETDVPLISQCFVSRGLVR